MVLGDNIFYGNGFSAMLRAKRRRMRKMGLLRSSAIIVNDPERFGIVEFDPRRQGAFRGGKAGPSQEQLLHYRPVFL